MRKVAAITSIVVGVIMVIAGSQAWPSSSESS
jgi:hypothetical protein